MKYFGPLMALAGLALAAMLVAHEDVGRIIDLVMASGPGLILAALFHVVPMALNARAWRRLLPGPTRPSARIMTWAVWVRESVNGLLPVGRIGGEIVAYRLLRRHGAGRAHAAASLVGDVTLSILSQATFAALGLGLLLASGGKTGLVTQLFIGLVTIVPLTLVFVLVQRAGAFQVVSRLVDKLAAGRLRSIVHESVQLDRAVWAVYQRRHDAGACFVWQFAGWLAGAGEIWLALHFLGQQRDVVDAILIEALIQALSSAAFVVPGALGVQEGGFVLIGAALGIDGATALALAAARRLRDLTIFFPGIIAWQRAEARGRVVKPSKVSESL